MPQSAPRCYSYVRFSTPEQIRGDSLRRQLQLSEEYARGHGLQLDETLTLRDEGLSAFNGQHVAKGALGIFLQNVKEGRVPSGSVLIVESLDRLSRKQVLDAFDLFRDIIRSGIKIVTLADNMEYSEETIGANFAQLMISLTIMSRAHEESLTKSRRLSSAWAGKREKIRDKKLTSRCPAWLELNEDGTEFRKIPERCRIVKRIFEMKLSGKGATLIIKELNTNKTAWQPKNGWRETYVRKILYSRAVLGEYQPHKMVKGRRTPVGEPIEDYFPRVVPDELFYSVKELMSRNKYFGGRNGKITNLFGGLAKCGYCGSSMQFIDKGPPPKGGQYLVCDNARRGRGCKLLTVKYKEFEELILTYCRGLEATDLLNEDEDRKSEISSVRDSLAGIEGKLKAVESEIENLSDTIATTSDQRVRNYLESRLTRAFDSKDSLEEAKRAAEQKIGKLTNAREDVESKIQGLRELISFMDSQKGQKLFDLRLKTRNQLRQLIDTVVVFPVGTISTILARANMEDSFDFDTTDEMKELERVLHSRIGDNKPGTFFDKDLRTFFLIFRGGSLRIISPTRDPRLTVDVDSDAGTIRYVRVNKEGKAESRTVVMEEPGIRGEG